MTPFTVKELADRIPWSRHWWWGGLPPVHNLRREDQKAIWLESYIATLLERELPQMGVRVRAPGLYKFWAMLTHIEVHKQSVAVVLVACANLFAGTYTSNLQAIYITVFVSTLPLLVFYFIAR